MTGTLLAPFSLLICSFKPVWAESPWNLNPQTELFSCTLAGLSQQAKGVRWQALSPRPQVAWRLLSFREWASSASFHREEETGGVERT